MLTWVRRRVARAVDGIIDIKRASVEASDLADLSAQIAGEFVCVASHIGVGTVHVIEADTDRLRE